MEHGLNTDEKKAGLVAPPLLHGALTEKIIGAAFEVHRVPGYGFLEKVYQRALQAELQRNGIKAELEHAIAVNYKGAIVGEYSADLLIESKVVIEIKVSPNCRPEDEAQLLNELKATGIKVGLLINFGRTKVEFKRLVF